jgi:hypothetical protein
MDSLSLLQMRLVIYMQDEGRHLVDPDTTVALLRAWNLGMYTICHEILRHHGY